jgi:hypothetical protein
MALKKNKEYIAIIEFLENFETIKYKIKSYLSYDNKRDNFLDLIKLNNSNQYDLYLEDSFYFLKNRLKFDFLNIFDYLGNIHFISDNGKIYLCNRSLEDYQLLSSAIDINPLISHYLLNYTYGLDNNTRYRFLNKSIEFKIYGDLEVRLKRYSDLHVHLGGALSYNHRLHSILKNINKVKLNQEHERMFNSIVGCDVSIRDIAFSASILENIFVKLYILHKSFTKSDMELFYQRDISKEKTNLIEYKNILNDLNSLVKFLESHENIYHYFHYRKYTEGFSNIRNSREVSHFYIFDNSFKDNLLKSMFENFGNNIVDMADKYLCLFLIEEMKSDILYKEIIEVYFILRTIIKKFIVQQHNREGLGYFSLYSGSKIRREKKGYERDYIIKSLIPKNAITHIQGRISLNKEPNKVMSDVIAYVKYFKKNKKRRDKLTFVFHFKKEEDKTLKQINKLHRDKNKIDKLLYLRPVWYTARKRIKYQAIALNSILSEPKYRKHRDLIVDGLTYKYKYRDYVKKYIAGIDVAGREFLTPPEVYAPAYRYFKNSVETSGFVLKRNYPYVPPEKLKEINFQYTYHVGEDFRDILSGLRAIYEAVLFLDLKDGDRLGHALALGVKPKDFLLIRNREIKLTKLEVLDNSIFAYYMMEKFNIDFIEIKNFLKELIFGLSKEIYKPLKGKSFGINDLIDAWFLRRNCPNEIKMCKNLFGNRIFTSKDKDDNRTYKLKETLENSALHYFIPNFDYVKWAMPDFFNLNLDRYSYMHNRYKYIQHNPIAYHLLWLYHKDADVIHEGAKNYDNNFFFEERFYESLQDIIMEHVIVKRDIVIESMLSSNILVGTFSTYTKHPIFRFKPIGKKIKPNRFNIRTKKLRVVLGTDNTGVQNSSFIRELQHLKNACKKLGHTNQECNKYIDEIVNDGNIIFNQSLL